MAQVNVIGQDKTVLVQIADADQSADRLSRFCDRLCHCGYVQEAVIIADSNAIKVTLHGAEYRGQLVTQAESLCGYIYRK